MTREDFLGLGVGERLTIPGHSSTVVLTPYYSAGADRRFKINCLTEQGGQFTLTEDEHEMVEREEQ